MNSWWNQTVARQFRRKRKRERKTDGHSWMMELDGGGWRPGQGGVCSQGNGWMSMRLSAPPMSCCCHAVCPQLPPLPGNSKRGTILKKQPLRSTLVWFRQLTFSTQNVNSICSSADKWPLCWSLSLDSTTQCYNKELPWKPEWAGTFLESDSEDLTGNMRDTDGSWCFVDWIIGWVT